MADNNFPKLTDYVDLGRGTPYLCGVLMRILVWIQQKHHKFQPDKIVSAEAKLPEVVNFPGHLIENIVGECLVHEHTLKRRNESWYMVENKTEVLGIIGKIPPHFAPGEKLEFHQGYSHCEKYCDAVRRNKWKPAAELPEEEPEDTGDKGRAA